MPQDEPVETPDAPNWKPITEPRMVFRFLKQPDPQAPDFADNFMSDGERGKTLAPGEHPGVLTGMSAFTSEDSARKMWRTLKASALKKRSERNQRRQKARPRPFKMSVGDHIGEVLLGPGCGFEVIDDGGVEGHLVIRGDKEQLAARVVEIYAAERQPT